MLHISIVGLGAISQKAYLPYMRQLKEIHWHLFTRNRDVLVEVDQLFAKSSIYNSLSDLAQVPLDGVFIHVATLAHMETAKLFLEKGVPVYMDKPLTEDFFSTLDLIKLAQSKGTFLMTGFNRRFAPRVIDLARLEAKRRVFVEKNDINRPGELRFKLFDFFIHPLDTALFISDEPPLSGTFSYHLEEGLLSQVMVNLETKHSQITVAMNLQSGSRREIMEVQTPFETQRLENLEELVSYKGTQKESIGFNSWDTTLFKRGFESIIDAFLEGIKSGTNPVTDDSTLLSHWICHQIARSKTNAGQLELELPSLV
ncbi:Gfo/Idh/MocA family protein [Streptococcus ictaluri]|uniref:Oxidoreductase, NAD-binding domain protein n=1 Tax=Streptococcus ictaluri 707-05 TaxID=764299 RepID=G5K0T5_9STRE|nr:Gfo/Idh/MocA family oxidoreductase [Streptococcus ictaluri]EHI70467.1 oxidoreductase, NAD-binding domain protein [Streptococcus ictaluri 707-05]